MQIIAFDGKLENKVEAVIENGNWKFSTFKYFKARQSKNKFSIFLYYGSIKIW